MNKHYDSRMYSALNMVVIIATERSIFSNHFSLPQLASSVPSKQSFSPSQRKLAGKQRFLLSQWWTQSSVCFIHCSSSERSWHWGTPSQIWSFWIHFFPWAHWNWSVWFQAKKKFRICGCIKITCMCDRFLLYSICHPNSGLIMSSL